VTTVPWEITPSFEMPIGSNHQAITSPPPSRLALWIREIGRNHILHGDAHGLIYGDLDIAEAACLSTESHCSESRSHRGIQAREFAATNRSRLKSV